MDAPDPSKRFGAHTAAPGGSAATAASETPPGATRMPRQMGAELRETNFTADSLPNPIESVKRGIRVLKLPGAEFFMLRH